MADPEGTAEPGGADEIAAAHDALLRDGVPSVRADLSRDEIAAVLGRDDISDLSQEDMMRLQMTMERRGKMTEAVSNLMKKQADTEQSIIENLK
jgi:DNA-binding transcriptional regulator YbjK